MLRGIIERPWLRIGLAVALLVVGLAPLGAPILSDNGLREALGTGTALAAAPAYVYRYDNQPDGRAQIQRSPAGSQRWSDLSAVPAPVLQLAAGSGEHSDIVLARTDQDIWRSEDSGVTWSKTQPLPSQPLSMALAPETAEALLAGTAANGLFVSRDRGQTWQAAGGPLSISGPGALAVSAVAFNPTDAQVIYTTANFTMATPQGTHSTQNAFVSVDGAQHWFQMQPKLAAGAADASTAGGAADRLIPVANQPLAVAAAGQNGAQSYELQATPQLIAALQDADPGVRAAAARALGLAGDHSVVPALLQAVHDTDLAAGDRAAEAIGLLGDRSAIAPLAQALGDRDEAVRGRAALALGMLKADETVPQLSQMLQNDGPLARSKAAAGLATLRSPAAVSALLRPLGDDQMTPARHAAMSGLEKMDEAAVPQLVTALHAENPTLRRNAAETLGWIKTSQAVPALAQSLSDPDTAVRSQAAWALGEIGNVPAQQVLASALAGSRDQTTRQATGQALAQAQKTHAERESVVTSPLSAFLAALTQVPASRWTLLFLVVALAAILLALNPRRTADQRA